MITRQHRRKLGTIHNLLNTKSFKSRWHLRFIQGILRRLLPFLEHHLFELREAQFWIILFQLLQASFLEGTVSGLHPFFRMLVSFFRLQANKKSIKGLLIFQLWRLILQHEWSLRIVKIINTFSRRNCLQCVCTFIEVIYSTNVNINVIYQQLIQKK